MSQLCTSGSLFLNETRKFIVNILIDITSIRQGCEVRIHAVKTVIKYWSRL